MNRQLFEKVITPGKLSARVAGFVLLTAIFSISAFAQSGGGGGGGGNGGGGGGGGVPGDTWIIPILYTAASCPLPTEIRNDYLEISFCALAKRSNDLSRYVLLVDGFTSLTPTVKNVNANVAVQLTCGNTVTLTKFTETAFAQTSPAPPPYRLSTLSGKVNDTCR